MKLMHTKLPEFILKMKRAVLRDQGAKALVIRGLENLKSAKLQSLRTGRIESAVEQIAGDDRVARVELVVMPRIPETMHTVVIKGLDRDGKPCRAILDVVNIIHPTEEIELAGCPEIDDRRPPLGKH
jgi:hypothetical protein